MADGANFDMSQIRDLAVDLASASADAVPAVRGVIAKAGVNMKAQMREESRSAASGTQRFKRIQYSINYDLTDTGLGVEVGPEPGLSGWKAQGSLAHIAYFGGVHSGPQFPEPAGVLEREAPVAEEWIGKVVGGLL